MGHRKIGSIKILNNHMKTLLTVVLLALGVNAQAQYIKYEPNPLPPSPSYTMNLPAAPAVTYSAPMSVVSTQTVVGYVHNTNKIVKLNVATIDGKPYVTGYRTPESTTWSELSTKIPLRKLTTLDDYSNQFEYKLYLPALLKDVYVQ